jgi:hypothetical protein
MVKRASRAATIRSQASTREKPVPAAAPSTAAMMGLGNRRMLRASSLSTPMRSTMAARGLSWYSRRLARLPPLQKCSPAPVSTAARTAGSVAARRNAAVAPRLMSGIRAFPCAGLSMVSSITPSRDCTSSFADIVASLFYAMRPAPT